MVKRKQLREWAQESAAALVRWEWFEQDRIINHVILDVYRHDIPVKQSVEYRDLVLAMMEKAASKRSRAA